MKRVIGAVAGVGVLLWTLGMGYADWRRYVWTYEYETMPKNSAELEYYVTFEEPNLHRSATNTWKHWLELEYGLTDNWDISMYQMFQQNNLPAGSNFEYAGFKVRSRYKIGKRGQFPVDPLLYLEYERDDTSHEPNVIEGKVVLAKDIGKFNIAYNQIFEMPIEHDALLEHQYAVGVNYQIFPNCALGVESKGNFTKDKYYIGPTIGFLTSRLWVSAGVLRGISKKADDVQARMIVGIPF